MISKTVNQRNNDIQCLKAKDKKTNNDLQNNIQKIKD